MYASCLKRIHYVWQNIQLRKSGKVDDHDNRPLKGQRTLLKLIKALFQLQFSVNVAAVMLVLKESITCKLYGNEKIVSLKNF